MIACLHVHNWRFDKTDRRCSVAQSKVIFFFICKFCVDKFNYQESIIMHKVFAYERAYTEEKIPILTFVQVPASAYERVSTNGNV